MTAPPSTVSRARRVGWAAALCGAVLLGACSPDRLVRSDPPSTVVNPDAINTPSAALALYNGASNIFASMYGGAASSGLDNYIISTGMMTDEFTLGKSTSEKLDQRSNSLFFSGNIESAQGSLYSRLQTARATAFQARQGLQKYGAPGSEPLIARMYAYEAYTIIFLAEYFCNGTPLTQTPLEGDAVYTAGLPTAELYARASALLDTALTLAGDSTAFANLAKVGKGRILLAQGKFADAAAAVADVPQTFVFNVEYRTGASLVINGVTYDVENTVTPPPPVQSFGVSGSSPFANVDNEGGNGLTWSTDPRVVDTTGVAYAGPTGVVFFTMKYRVPNAPIRLADGIEAQLIQAEAEFQADPNGTAWLTRLNTLRATCTSASGCAPVPGITGTTLTPLPDSGTARGRLREILAERAYWMYATGHREGDLRRMLRPPYDAPPYAFTQSDLYPTGAYTNPSYTGATTAYGSDVVAIPSRNEQLYNPKYNGCIDLNP